MKSDILLYFYKIRTSEVSSQIRPVINLALYSVSNSGSRRCYLQGAQRSGNFLQSISLETQITLFICSFSVCASPWICLILFWSSSNCVSSHPPVAPRSSLFKCYCPMCCKPISLWFHQVHTISSTVQFGKEQFCIYLFQCFPNFVNLGHIPSQLSPVQKERSQPF